MIPADQLMGAKAPSGPDKPIEHLAACHRRIEQRLDTLVRAAGAFPARREEALAAASAAMSFLNSSGLLHTLDEEESFFPRLRPKLDPADAEAIERLQHEHKEAEAVHAALEALIAAAPDAPDSAWIASYAETAAKLREIYSRHIAEEDALFPRLAKVLDGEDLEGMAAEMKARRG